MLKKIVVSFLVVALVLGSSTSVILAMTKPAQIELPQATLHVMQGTVYLKESGTYQWISAIDGIKVDQGDAIKTGANSQAFINFFDNSSTRLDSNTQITLTQAEINTQNLISYKVRYELDFGRVWARIINLLDRESRFEITSQDTVAAIRGTAVSAEVPQIKEEDNRPRKLNIAVSEGAIEVANSQSQAKIKVSAGEKIAAEVQKDAITPVIDDLPEEEEDTTIISDSVAPLLRKARLQESGIQISEITNLEKESTWFKDNKSVDEDYIKQVEEKKKDILEEQAGPLPGSPLYGLKTFAEKVAIATTANKNELVEKQIQFANRRLIEGAVLAEKGEKIAAAKQIEIFKKDVDVLGNEIENLFNSQTTEGKQEAVQIKSTIERAMSLPRHLVRTTLPGDESFRAKNQIQKALINIQPTVEDKIEKEEEILEINKKDLKRLLVEENYDAAKTFIKSLDGRVSEEEQIAIIDEIPIEKVQQFDQFKEIGLANERRLELKLEERLPIETRSDVEELEDGSFQEILPDGTVRTVRPNGEIEKVLPDKSKHIVTTDGKFKQIKSNGEIIETFETDKTTVIKQIFPDGNFLEKTILKPQALRERQKEEASTQNVTDETIEETEAQIIETKTFEDNTTEEIITNKNNESEKVQIKKDNVGNIISRRILNVLRPNTDNIPETNTELPASPENRAVTEIENTAEQNTDTKTDSTVNNEPVTANTIIEAEKDKREIIIQELLSKSENDPILSSYIYNKYGTKQAVIEELKNIKNLDVLQESINEIQNLAVQNHQAAQLGRSNLKTKIRTATLNDEKLISFLKTKNLTSTDIMRQADEMDTTEEMQRFFDDLMHTVKVHELEKEELAKQDEREKLIDQTIEHATRDINFKNVALKRFGSLEQLKVDLKALGDINKINEVYQSLKQEAASNARATNSSDTQTSDISNSDGTNNQETVETETPTIHFDASNLNTQGTSTEAEKIKEVDPKVELMIEDFLRESNNSTLLQNHLASIGHSPNSFAEHLKQIDNAAAIDVEITNLKKNASIERFINQELHTEEAFIIFMQDQYGSKSGLESKLRAHGTVDAIESFIENFKASARNSFEALKIKNDAQNLFKESSTTSTSAEKVQTETSSVNLNTSSTINRSTTTNESDSSTNSFEQEAQNLLLENQKITN